jgi:hypothetical protein
MRLDHGELITHVMFAVLEGARFKLHSRQTTPSL